MLSKRPIAQTAGGWSGDRSKNLIRTSVSCARSVEELSGLGMAFSGGMLEKEVADGKAGLLRGE